MERKRVGRIQDWKAKEGSLRCERLARDIVMFRPVGHLEGDFAGLVELGIDEAIEDGRPHCFWDGQAMAGYATDFRVRVGAYCARAKPDVASMVIFTPSSFVAMGVAVINVLLGGFYTVTKTRAEFERVFDEVKRTGQFVR